jgi:heat shock protein HslJ
MGRVVLFAALVLAVASCTYGSDPPPPPAAVPAPPQSPPGPAVPGPVEPVPVGEDDEDAAWRLVSGRGPTGEIAVGDRVLTLVLGERRLGGFSGCNQFGMRARIEGDRVRARGPLVSTLIRCEDEILAVEGAYTTALREVTRIERTAARLVLRGPGTRLDFEPCRLAARGPGCEPLGAGNR